MLKALFAFNRQATAAKVLPTIAPNPEFTERELERCFLNFTTNMRGMAATMKYMGGAMAIMGVLVAGKMAMETKPVPAAVGGVVAVAAGLFARRQSHQQAFYGELLQETADRQLVGARKKLTALAAGN